MDLSLKNKGGALKMPKPEVGEIRMFPPPDSFEAAHMEEWTVQRYCKNGRWQTVYGKEREKALAEYENQERTQSALSERAILEAALEWADSIVKEKIERQRTARKKAAMRRKERL